MPNKPDIDAISSSFAATMLESLPQMECKTITHTFPTATPDALDLIRICFHFNPEKRPSAEELLCHEYVAEFHNEEEEPVYPGGPLILPIDDNTKLTAAQYRYVICYEYMYVYACFLVYSMSYISVYIIYDVYSYIPLCFLLYFSPSSYYTPPNIHTHRIYTETACMIRSLNEDANAGKIKRQNRLET